MSRNPEWRPAFLFIAIKIKENGRDGMKGTGIVFIIRVLINSQVMPAIFLPVKEILSFAINIIFDYHETPSA